MSFFLKITFFIEWLLYKFIYIVGFWFSIFYKVCKMYLLEGSALCPSNISKIIINVQTTH